MRRMLIFVLFAVCILTACSKTVSSNTEMLQVIKLEKNISIELYELGVVKNDKSVLMIGITGERAQNYYYHSAEFSIEGNNKYKFLKLVPLYSYGWQLKGCWWQDGIVFICNNENATLFQATIIEKNKEPQIIKFEITTIPWIYHFDLSHIEGDYDANYTFYDKNGKEII